MSHLQKLDEYAVISVATAAAILGGDGGPVSPGTVYRLLRDGQLTRAGKGKVTTESMRAYLAGGVRSPAAAPAPAPAPMPRPSTSQRRAPTAAPEPEDWRRLIRFPKGQRRAG